MLVVNCLAWGCIGCFGLVVAVCFRAPVGSFVNFANWVLVYCCFVDLRVCGLMVLFVWICGFRV